MDDPGEIETAAPSPDGAAEARTAGLLAFHRLRKQDSRERLLAAAMEKFCQKGYFSVSVEDIAAAAGVSRMTFYRQFSGKAALTADLFRHAADTATPIYISIRDKAFDDPLVVREWISAIFATDRTNRQLLRVFTQATADDGGFTERAQQWIGELIAGLGRSITAFDVDPGDPHQRRRWHEAWLLLYEILDQSNHAALGSGVASEPYVIDILAERFLAFVRTR